MKDLPGAFFHQEEALCLYRPKSKKSRKARIVQKNFAFCSYNVFESELPAPNSKKAKNSTPTSETNNSASFNISCQSSQLSRVLNLGNVENKITAPSTLLLIHSIEQKFASQPLNAHILIQEKCLSLIQCNQNLPNTKQLKICNMAYFDFFGD